MSHRFSSIDLTGLRVSVDVLADDGIPDCEPLPCDTCAHKACPSRAEAQKRRGMRVLCSAYRRKQDHQ